MSPRPRLMRNTFDKRGRGLLKAWVWVRATIPMLLVAALVAALPAVVIVSVANSSSVMGVDEVGPVAWRMLEFAAWAASVVACLAVLRIRWIAHRLREFMVCVAVVSLFSVALVLSMSRFLSDTTPTGTLIGVLMCTGPLAGLALHQFIADRATA